MPFQGNPNAGAMDPALLSLLFQQRARREDMAFEREKYEREFSLKSSAAQAKRAREDRAAALDEMQKRLDIAAALSEKIGPQVDQARRNVETTDATNFTEEDLLADGGGEDFAAVVQQNDPTTASQLQASNAARAYFAAQLSGAIPAVREMNPNVDPVSALLGAGTSTETQRARKATLKLDETVATERRGEAKDVRMKRLDQTITQQNTRFADSLRDDNIVSDAVAEELGALDSLEVLQKDRKATEKMLNRRAKAGLPTDALEERLKFIDSRVYALKNPRTSITRSPIPFSERATIAQQFTGSDFALKTIGRLSESFRTGAVVGGATGLVIDAREKARSLFEQAFSMDPTIVEGDLGQLVQQAVQSGETTVRVSDQLTLGLDQLFLAYAYSRMGRGNARFTIKEMSTIMDELGFKGVFTSPEQIRGALRKVASSAVQEKTTAYALLADDPEFRDSLRTLESLPEDRALLKSLEGDTWTNPAPREIPSNATGKKRKPTDWKTATPEELLREFGE